MLSRPSGGCPELGNSQNRGTPFIPQLTRLPLKGPPKRVPLFRKPQLGPSDDGGAFRLLEFFFRFGMTALLTESPVIKKDPPPKGHSFVEPRVRFGRRPLWATLTQWACPRTVTRRRPLAPELPRLYDVGSGPRVVAWGLRAWGLRTLVHPQGFHFFRPPFNSGDSLHLVVLGFGV